MLQVQKLGVGMVLLLRLTTMCSWSMIFLSTSRGWVTPFWACSRQSYKQHPLSGIAPKMTLKVLLPSKSEKIKQRRKVLLLQPLARMTPTTQAIRISKRSRVSPRSQRKPRARVTKFQPQLKSPAKTNRTKTSTSRSPSLRIRPRWPRLPKLKHKKSHQTSQRKSLWTYTRQHKRPKTPKWPNKTNFNISK